MYNMIFYRSNPIGSSSPCCTVALHAGHNDIDGRRNSNSEHYIILVLRYFTLVDNYIMGLYGHCSFAFLHARIERSG